MKRISHIILLVVIILFTLFSCYLTLIIIQRLIITQSKMSAYTVGTLTPFLLSAILGAISSTYKAIQLKKNEKYSDESTDKLDSEDIDQSDRKKAGRGNIGLYICYILYGLLILGISIYGLFNWAKEFSEVSKPNSIAALSIALGLCLVGLAILIDAWLTRKPINSGK